MLNFALDGLWLLGSLVVAYLLGVFTAQYAKDKLTGVPSAVRTALKALEAKTATAVADAKAKAVADAVRAIAPAMPTPPAKVVVLPDAAPLALSAASSAPAAPLTPVA